MASTLGRSLHWKTMSAKLVSALVVLTVTVLAGASVIVWDQGGLEPATQNNSELIPPVEGQTVTYRDGCLKTAFSLRKAEETTEEQAKG